MIKSDVSVCEINRSLKRKTIAISLIIFILASFWTLSRYPDLLIEYHRSTQHTITERNVGALSKDELMSTKAVQSNVTVAATTMLNWLDTNKIGMTFGILFATAILLLLEQSTFLYRRAAKRGLVWDRSWIIVRCALRGLYKLRHTRQSRNEKSRC